MPRIPFLLLIACGAVLVTGEPYHLHPELATTVRTIVAEGAGQDRIGAAGTAIDAAIATVLRGRPQANEDEHLAQLVTLRGALARLVDCPQRAVALAIFERPLACSRLIHALDDDDDPVRFWGILQVLYQAHPDDLHELFELVLAIALVWDSYQGHPWATERKGPVAPDHWQAVFAHFESRRDRLRANPRTMPYELGIYTVAVRLDADEIAWVDGQYGRQDSPDGIFRSVPWTKKLSPLSGTGDKIPYTLANICRFGGACYEQAYVTESVLRLQGLPATMAIGRGKRGTHAWIGALRTARPVTWDFSFGRYSYDHYFKGEVEDPTAPGKVLPDSSVKLTAALMTAGSRDNIELGHVYLAAATWVGERLGQDPAWTPALVDTLLAESLERSPLAVATWDHLRTLAAAGAFDDGELIRWTGRLVRQTGQRFPDYTVEWITAALQGTANTATRLLLCRSGLEAVKNRPDLVAELKVVEGDLLLATGDRRRAVDAYCHPLSRFSRDGHALDAVRERIAGLGASIKDTAEREATLLDLLRSCPISTDRNQSILREIRQSVLDQLIGHYRDAGDTAATERYRTLRQ